MTTKQKRNTITITDAAAMFGKTRQAVSRTLKRAGIAPEADGMFDAVAVFSAVRDGAMADKNACADGGAGHGLQARKLEAQIRNLEATAERAEIEIGRIKKTLIPRDVYLDDMKNIVWLCRRTIDVWVKTTANAVGSVEMKHKLEQAQRQAFAAVQAEYEESIANETPIQ